MNFCCSLSAHPELIQITLERNDHFIVPSSENLDITLNLFDVISLGDLRCCDLNILAKFIQQAKSSKM